MSKNIKLKEEKLKFLDFLYTFDKHLKTLDPDRSMSIKFDLLNLENVKDIFDITFVNDENEFPTQRICLELDKDISIPEYLNLIDKADITYDNFCIGKFFKVLNENHKLDGNLKPHPYRDQVLFYTESMSFLTNDFENFQLKDLKKVFNDQIKKQLKIK
jgi:hypothetical protein